MIIIIFLNFNDDTIDEPTLNHTENIKVLNYMDFIDGTGLVTVPSSLRDLNLNRLFRGWSIVSFI